jgi:hypothetical protein
MMRKQELLFENLKRIKDYWTNTSVESLDKNSDLMWTDSEEQYKILQNKLETPEEKAAFRKIQDEIIRGVIHSILVMVDGGDDLADHMLVDIIDENTKESLKNGTALHEEFISYLLDKEE